MSRFVDVTHRECDSKIAALKLKLEAAKVENAALRELGGAEQGEDMAEFVERVKRQRAEYDALQADAERYRWMRDRELPEWMDVYHQHPDRVDERIDAARGGE